MRGYARGHRGECWEPAPLLVELADAGLSFNDFAARKRTAA
jgi:3-hydroxyacyl-CoA dehydrogenase